MSKLFPIMSHVFRRQCICIFRPQFSSRLSQIEKREGERGSDQTMIVNTTCPVNFSDLKMKHVLPFTIVHVLFKFRRDRPSIFVKTFDNIFPLINQWELRPVRPGLNGINSTPRFPNPQKSSKISLEKISLEKFPPGATPLRNSIVSYLSLKQSSKRLLRSHHILFICDILYKFRIHSFKFKIQSVQNLSYYFIHVWEIIQ